MIVSLLRPIAFFVNIPEKQDLCKKSYKFEANCPPL